MSTNVLPPKLPNSKPPSLPVQQGAGGVGNRNTINGGTIKAPSTPPPPIPPRNPSSNDLNQPMNNLNLNGSNGSLNGGGVSPPIIPPKPARSPIHTPPISTNNNISSHILAPHSNSGLNHSTPSPINSPNTSHSPNTHSPTFSGRPLPQPKIKEQPSTVELKQHENSSSTTDDINTGSGNGGSNSFKSVLNQHSQNNLHHSQYNTSPIPLNNNPSRPLPLPRKLPPSPLPHVPNRNTISVNTHPLDSINITPTTTTTTTTTPPNTEQPQINTQSSRGTVKISSKNDLEISFSSNQSLAPSYPDLDHLSQFTSTRDLKVKEILLTERTYVDNMKILVDVFIEPLKIGEGGISKECATVICSNLADILMVGVELLARLEEKLKNWSDTQTIGDVFRSLTPFLKMYTNYTVGFDNVLTIVSECEKNSSFTTFISKCTEDARTKKLDLRSYLIQPVQRITRYNMLLDEVIKYTDESHVDYENLKKSYEEMRKVTLEANEAIKKSENRAKVFEIQKMFVKDPEIVAAHREYVFDGVLTKVCRKACKKRYVFLFSDLLVYGSSIPPKLMLHEKIELDHCRIEDIPDGSSSITNNGQAINNAFQINSNKKSFVVFADSLDLKIKWMLNLTQTIDLLQEKRKTIKTVKITRTEAPLWTPDDSNPNCTLCNDAFSFYNRRHHCRKCGALVDNRCSSNKFKLPISDYKPVRVCDTCFNTLNESLATTQVDE